MGGHTMDAFTITDNNFNVTGFFDEISVFKPALITYNRGISVAWATIMPQAFFNRLKYIANM